MNIMGAYGDKSPMKPDVTFSDLKSNFEMSVLSVKRSSAIVEQALNSAIDIRNTNTQENQIFPRARSVKKNGGVSRMSRNNIISYDS